ncbi:hypothetical protein GCM10007977_026400 [Dactylosporangium sucinum]|uniref:Uncharacterized protein n=1 Tax=Dactylosporangium sucinum TaxID=1424081 RepID=A0A917TI15_9ACTN|nr:hypothetical protein GCM10007977_026400 [Dactylosporangium sucinum]
MAFAGAALVLDDAPWQRVVFVGVVATLGLWLAGAVATALIVGYTVVKLVTSQHRPTPPTGVIEPLGSGDPFVQAGAARPAGGAVWLRLGPRRQ